MRTPTRLTLLVLMASLALSACSVLPKGPPPAVEHDLGPVPPDLTFQPHRMPVYLNDLSLPSWLAGNDILYRNVAEDPTRVQRYANHVWRVAPVQLLGDRLAYLGIPREKTPENRYRLDLRLEDFEQVMTGPQSAHVSVQIIGNLRAPDGHLISSHRFVDQSPTGADLQGALTGLTAAAQRQIGNINSWLFDTLQRQPDEGRSRGQTDDSSQGSDQGL